MIRLSFPELGIKELLGVRRVFASRMLVQGKEVEKFEKSIAGYIGVKHAVAVSSGTAALHLALLAVDIKPGDEVIAPAFTFPATTNVIEHVKAEVKLVDIDLQSFGMSIESLKKSISNKSRAIMVVHEFGQSADLSPILALARERGLPVIEDAACALGAEYKGQRVGKLGTAGCFSFHPRKAITTGEGGILVTDSDEIAEKVRCLRNHGMQKLENGLWQFVDAGLNYRMTDIQGAIATVQMRRLSGILQKRIELAEVYNQLLFGKEGLVIPSKMEYGLHVYQTYHLLLDVNVNRAKVITRLKDRGIETNFGAYAVHEQSYYLNKYNFHSSELINSSHAYHHGLALPLHHRLSKRDISYVVNELISAISEFTL